MSHPPTPRIEKLHASYIQSVDLRLKEMHDNRAVAFLEQVNPYGARAGIQAPN